MTKPWRAQARVLFPPNPLSRARGKATIFRLRWEQTLPMIPPRLHHRTHPVPTPGGNRREQDRMKARTKGRMACGERCRREHGD